MSADNRRNDMPCNCDYMEPSRHESESKRLMTLMAGVGIYKGEIPYYGEVSAVHEHTAMLCKFCEENNVTDQSLELQIWWRDHQEADKAKREAAAEDERVETERREAIAKLTDRERDLLGL